ncbi:hypothetical protein RRG08_005805 [Elysia crispata]|uniref:Uncharacterized protein n=1 Tax=Elysia crispata TaxID=231223 RepID=A0AAE1DW45_9GAST|nr:hypothetical protein RRG08_005805 [Elysia crispata]
MLNRGDVYDFDFIGGVVSPHRSLPVGGVGVLNRGGHFFYTPDRNTGEARVRSTDLGEDILSSFHSKRMPSVGMFSNPRVTTRQPRGNHNNPRSLPLGGNHKSFAGAKLPDRRQGFEARKGRLCEGEATGAKADGCPRVASGFGDSNEQVAKPPSKVGRHKAKGGGQGGFATDLLLLISLGARILEGRDRGEAPLDISSSGRHI